MDIALLKWRCRIEWVYSSFQKFYQLCDSYQLSFLVLITPTSRGNYYVLEQVSEHFQGKKKKEPDC